MWLRWQVVLTVFQYIKMIQLSGPKREIYDEISKLEEIDFRFQEPVSGILKGLMK
jgi:secreted Zn-dependent insulinase-like peptidase